MPFEPADNFDLSEERLPGGVDVIAVTGYVDFDVSPRLKDCMVSRIETGARRLVIDLTDAGFIDSTAIGVLVGAHKRMLDRGGSFAVVCPDPIIRGLFETIGLDEVIDLPSSRDEAIASLALTA
jgi:anti-sigma B factor antagonist